MTSPRNTTDLADDFATAALLDFSERFLPGTPAPQDTVLDKAEAAILRDVEAAPHRAEHLKLGPPV